MLPLRWGITAGLAMPLLFFGILTFANSPMHAWEQFQQLWYWLLPLAAGFGLQVGLFAHMHLAFKYRRVNANAALATSGSFSTVSMVACCAHHFTDIVPIIGFTAAAVFLNRYQTAFLTIGLLSNLIGITIMLRHIKRHRLYEPYGILSTLFHRMKALGKAKAGSLRAHGLSTGLWIIIGIGFLFAFTMLFQNPPVTDAALPAVLSPGSAPAQGAFSPITIGTDGQGDVRITLTPQGIRNGQLEVAVAANTHSVDLSPFDLKRIAVLSYGRKAVQPISAPALSGHHASGTLTFPLADMPEQFAISLNGIPQQQERVFKW